jgi:hypothetical protein
MAAAILSLVAALACLAPGRAAAQTASADAPKNAGPAGPTPRTADGHPDLSGLWMGGGAGGDVVGTDPDADADISVNFNSRGGSFLNFERDNTILRRMDPNRPQYKPQFWEKVQNLDQNGNTEDPAYSCMPPGLPRMGPPRKIVQTVGEFVFLYLNPDTYRVIPADGRTHSKEDDLEGTWKGEARAIWDRDTLVVDTIGFNDSSWLAINGYFHSENMHVIERIRRDGNALVWQATVEDPDVLIKPWIMNPVTLRLNPNPKAELEESLPCSERDLSHLVTKEHH